MRMTDRRKQARRRRWADVAIIGASLYALMIAVFSPQFVAPREAEAAVRAQGWWWGGTALAGALGIAAVLFALRSTLLARALTVLAGLLLLSTLLAFERIEWIAWVAVIVPAIVLLGAAPFVGPMPTPEEEGHWR